MSGMLADRSTCVQLNTLKRTSQFWHASRCRGCPDHPAAVWYTTLFAARHEHLQEVCPELLQELLVLRKLLPRCEDSGERDPTQPATGPPIAPMALPFSVRRGGCVSDLRCANAWLATFRGTVRHALAGKRRECARCRGTQGERHVRPASTKRRRVQCPTWGLEPPLPLVRTSFMCGGSTLQSLRQHGAIGTRHGGSWGAASSGLCGASAVSIAWSPRAILATGRFPHEASELVPLNGL